jgi:hypothetical protein
MELAFAARIRTLCHFGFQVAVEVFIGIQVRAVAGQVEQFQLLRTLLDPLFHHASMMNPKIVQDQEHLPVGRANQSAQEPNERLGVQTLARTTAGVTCSRWVDTLSLSRFHWPRQRTFWQAQLEPACRQAQLESGEYASLEDLPKDVGCDRTYVGRMLRLTSLAPDIIEAILRGDEPAGLSLEKLRKHLR